MMQQLKRFGTFSGVFLPNVLTILGVILFYRESWLVGNAGLGASILIILLANLITVSTSLSMSAIVTNIRIRGGGAYFLVSRSLGPEIGGAIGVSLFFAQAFSIAFYIIGFTSSLVLLKPFIGVDPLILNLGTLGVLTVLSIFSANFAIKAQYFILAILLVALGSFFLGNTGFSENPAWIGEFNAGDFWFSFAIFFPATTGIFTGLSLSGDLKDPHKNLPRGTIASVIVTGLIYLAVAVFFAFNHGPQALLGGEHLMQESALVPELVLVGIFAATISSAIGMILAAPRTLQALASDGMVPRPFAKGFGPANEPRVAMLLSVALALGLLLVGDLNMVSRILTMFFLTSYGAVNLAATIENLVGNPAYRPKFHVHWVFSFFGGVGSFFAMFMIDPLATVIALVLLITLYGLYTRKNLRSDWGDIRQGFWASVIEIGLANYHKYAQHPKNFRPHVAILENQRRGRKVLVDLAALLIGKHGVASNYVMVRNRADQSSEAIADELARVESFLIENGTPYIRPEVIACRNNSQAPLLVLQADGIGAFRNNTILTDFYTDDSSLEGQLKIISDYLGLRKNVLLVKGDEGESGLSPERIDIWLSGFTANLSIMLLFPYLVTRNTDWATTRIIMRMIVRTREERETAQKKIHAILTHSRIDAEAEVISLDSDFSILSSGFQQGSRGEGDRRGLFIRLVDFFKELSTESYTDDERARINEIIALRSADAGLVVMGMRIPDSGKERRYARELLGLLKRLPKTVLVRGQENVNLFK